MSYCDGVSPTDAVVLVVHCQLARKAYHDVDTRLFEKYIEEKSGPVVGALEQNMYVGAFDWSSTYHVTGARLQRFLYTVSGEKK